MTEIAEVTIRNITDVERTGRSPNEVTVERGMGDTGSRP